MNWKKIKCLNCPLLSKAQESSTFYTLLVEE